jgi:hypothetical protein
MRMRRDRRIARRQCEIIGAIAGELDGASAGTICDVLGRKYDDVAGHLVWLEHHGRVVSEWVTHGESGYRVYWLRGWKR